MGIGDEDGNGEIYTGIGIFLWGRDGDGEYFMGLGWGKFNGNGVGMGMPGSKVGFQKIGEWLSYAQCLRTRETEQNVEITEAFPCCHTTPKFMKGYWNEDCAA